MFCRALVSCRRQTFSIGIVALLFSAPLFAQQYKQTNLVSNTGDGGAKKDANLVNGWGISRSSSSPWWVSGNGSGHATLYNGDGSIVPLVVTVPGGPTGTVFNATSGFEIQGSPALFLFSAEDGTISAWNKSLGTQAMVVATGHNSVYKGLAIASFRGASYLYATDFHNGKVDVYDTNFNLVRKGFNGDGDRDGDDLPGIARKLRGFAPFGIQNIGGTIFVTFAKQDSDRHDDVAGPGNGFVAAFTPSGKLIRFFEPGPWLNSPWGLTLAPSDFGVFSHHLLIGQFGSGEIAAYEIASGKFAGLLRNDSNEILSIDGLWGIGFGNGASSGPANALFFAAGPNHEGDGLFGMLTTTAADPSVGNSN